MDVDLEAPSGEESEETLILKIGGKDEEEGGAHGKGVENELSVDLDVVGGGERVVEDKAGDVEGMKSGIGEKKVDDDPLEDVDVEIGESGVRGRIGDGGERVEPGVGEKEVVTSDLVDEKSSRDVDDDDLSEDVDIDDSGDVRTGICGHDAVDAGGNEVGNGSGNVEDTTSADKLEKENEMAVEGVAANISEDTYAKGDKTKQDDAIGEPVSGKSGGGTVGILAGESEDEEVDIGGDREPNMFTNPSIATDENVRSEPKENVLHASYQLAAGKEGGFFCV